MNKISCTIVCIVLLLGCKEQTRGKSNPPETSEVSENTILSAQNTIKVGLGPDALFLTPDKRFLYVANVEDTLISVVDTKTDKVMHQISGVRYPWGFAKLGTSDIVAVSGYDKQIVLIDFTSHSIVKRQSFDSTLGGVVSSSDGKIIFVIAIDKQKVLQLDGRSLAFINSYDTGKGPDGIGISKEDDKLYVTNTEDGTIGIINIKTKETLNLEKGGKPELIHASKDNTRLLISNFLNNEAYVLNTVSDSIVYTFIGLSGPEEVILSEDEKRIYIVNFKNSKVYVYDGRSFERLPQVYQVGKSPIGFVEIGNTKAYVSNYGDNSLTVLNLK
jgi:YVTN family beta-propeller protein